MSPLRCSVLALLSAIVVLPIAVWAQDDAAIIKRAPAPGDKLASFDLLTEKNTPYSWSPGRATLITFCAFWCDTWKQHLQRVAEARHMLNGLPVDVLAISVDGRWTELGERAPYLNYLTMLKDPGGSWSSRIGIDRVPFTMAIDADGYIRWIGHGIARSDDMAAAARESLQPRATGGTIYLTFDDFPKPNGEELLDVLRREQVPASFFCICSRAEVNAAMLKRAVREGHALEIHCWEHDEREPSLERCQNALVRAACTRAEFCRAPGSEAIASVTGEPLKAPIVDPYDYQRPGVRELLRRVLPAMRAGCVIQLHTGVSDTLAALPEIIRTAKNRRFIFKSLGSPTPPTHSE